MPEFRILGPLEAVVDGQPVPLGGLRQRALLALLLLHARQVVPTDRLVDALYGESPPKTAVTSLQNAVAALRRALGADVLVTRAPGYMLLVEPEHVDAERFEGLLRDARARPPQERVAALEKALALWRGPPLADVGFAIFAQAESRRLEELRLDAVEGRIGAELELGRHAEVVGQLEGLVRANPLRERLWLLLMLALYRSGRQAEALDAYRSARAALVEELGIEPGPELRELQASILRQEAGLAPAAATAVEDTEGDVARALLAGRLVPVLGLDGAAELAQRLARAFDVPRDEPLDLPRVSQYVATINGSGPLYDELHRCFEEAVEPGAVHRLLAALPAVLRGHGADHQLIVTTRYDLALERAFEAAGEELDVVTYVAAGPWRGRFWHRPPGGEPTPIDVPNTYATELSLARRTVLLKLHGAVDLLPDREWESFVVTEDDFIDYLGHSDLASAVPVALAARLRRSHFLFLGYQPVGWSLRLVLHRLWGDRPVAYRSWAVQAAPAQLERAFWRRFDVEVVDADPEAYAGLLAGRVGATA